MNLDLVQARVLGTLMEKEIVTPEHYPLSLNALVAGCNQRSSRHPVMEVTDETVQSALHVLEAAGLTSVSRDSRVPKFEHRARTVLALRRDETAILCLLLLRGPQTPGELRSRADRMYAFEDLAAVESTLRRMAQDASEQQVSPDVRPIVKALPRQAGSREVRYAHLLSGSEILEPQDARGAERGSRDTPDAEDGDGVPLARRIMELEIELEALRTRIARLEARLEPEFRERGAQVFDTTKATGEP